MNQNEQILYSKHPDMIRNSPLGFLVCLLMISVFGLGILLLLFCLLNSLGTTLIVTDRRTVLRHGILSKSTNEVFLLVHGFRGGHRMSSGGGRWFGYADGIDAHPRGPSAGRPSCRRPSARPSPCGSIGPSASPARSR